MASIKILYAEDEIFLGKIIKESLESRNFNVLMETNGLKVKALFEKEQPDICVLDIMLPGMDGLMIAREIRKLDQAVPILFLTAKTQTEDVINGFSAGGNDYLCKPFSMEELISRLQNLLQHKITKMQKITNGKAVIGKFCLHINRQVLINGTEEQKLSFRESELLKIFYECRESIVDRKYIIQELWGYDSRSNNRSLDVYISKIRSYLRKDSTLEIINIKGVGYKFIYRK